MEPIDKIVFGDNQFFGINHMSQEKAQRLTELFFKIENIIKVYDYAFDSGINAIMLNSNDRAGDICDFFRLNNEKYGHINWYPSIPYPHKYANMVSEFGIIGAINKLLIKDRSIGGTISLMKRGGSALLTKDVVKLMKLLVDIEMRTFFDLNVKVIFLQNIITDLLLGFDIKEIFESYCNHICNTYNALPGLITQNLPHLIAKLTEWGIDNVVLCSSFNKIGYLMSPCVQEYIDIARENDSTKFQLMGMSTLASGAIKADKAYEFIGKQNIQSVVFGASTKEHIEETVSLIKKYD